VTSIWTRLVLVLAGVGTLLFAVPIVLVATD
jgi:hypothetical protein